MDFLSVAYPKCRSDAGYKVVDVKRGERTPECVSVIDQTGA